MNIEVDQEELASLLKQFRLNHLSNKAIRELTRMLIADRTRLLYRLRELEGDLEDLWSLTE